MVPRIRTIKPEFFRHWDLYAAEKETKLPLRLSFIGLWICCDREGRFRWHPEELKSVILPHDSLDFSRVLNALAERQFIGKYEIEGHAYGYVPSWGVHQYINQREAKSFIPAPDERTCVHVQARVEREGKGRELEGKGTVRASTGSADALASLWNENCGSLPKVLDVTEDRVKKCRLRVERHSLEQFEAAIRVCAETPFLRGENDRGWTASFDWLMENDKNVQKVLEGNYKNGGQKHGAEGKTERGAAAIAASRGLLRPVVGSPARALPGGSEHPDSTGGGGLPAGAGRPKFN